MSDPVIFKYDVRVRERMLKRGLVTEADIKRHLEGLSDLEPTSGHVELAQPAIGVAGAARGAPAVRHAPDDEVEAS